jgi:hypothetical protein
MDLRSVKPGIAAGSQMPLFMVDPVTGRAITPMGWTKRGLPIWPMIGGAPDDDSDGDKDDKNSDEDDSEEDDEEDEDSEEDDDDDSDDDDSKRGKKKGNAKAKIKALEEEKDRHFRKAKRANKERDAALAELAALKAKYESGEDEDDEDDNGKTKGKNKDKPKVIVDDSKIREAEAAAQKLRVENAFLRVNEVTWIKPEQALALMLADDDYEVEFDDDGKVDRKSLRAELKRFAKANPHLVKKAEPKDDDKDSDEGDDAPRATASRMNGKRKGSKKSDKELTREQLAKKFPALVNRLN